MSADRDPASFEHSSERVFEQLFNDHYTDILAYAARRVPEDADDIVSEVFAIAWRRRADLGEVNTPLAWLYAIAGNIVRNRRRGDGRRLRLLERVGRQRRGVVDDPADLIGGTVRAALSTLSHDDQEVLRLVAWEDLDHRTIGEILGCSTTAVGVRLHRARQRLRQALEAIEAN